MKREREGEGEGGISTLAMHSTPTGIEFESFVQRGRTHMLMHTLPQSTQSPHTESSWKVDSSAACAADQKPLIVIEWLRLQKKLLTVCPKVCVAFASVFCRLLRLRFHLRFELTCFCTFVTLHVMQRLGDWGTVRGASAATALHPVHASSRHT